MMDRHPAAGRRAPVRLHGRDPRPRAGQRRRARSSCPSRSPRTSSSEATCGPSPRGRADRRVARDRDDALARQPAVLVVDDDDGRPRAGRLRPPSGGLRGPRGGDRRGRPWRSLGQAAVGLVVLDMAMPGMSGTDVVQALRARPETATLPVLLMTGSGDDGQRHPGPGCGRGRLRAEAGPARRAGRPGQRPPAQAGRLVVRGRGRAARTGRAWSRPSGTCRSRRSPRRRPRRSSTRSRSGPTATSCAVAPAGRRRSAAGARDLQPRRRRPPRRPRLIAAAARADPRPCPRGPVGRGGRARAGRADRRVLARARPDLAAGAPIYAGDELVGHPDDRRSTPRTAVARGSSAGRSSWPPRSTTPAS